MFDELATEARDPGAADLDLQSTLALVRQMNQRLDGTSCPPSLSGPWHRWHADTEGYTPWSRSNQYSKYRTSDSTGTSPANASTCLAASCFIASSRLGTTTTFASMRFFAR